MLSMGRAFVGFGSSTFSFYLREYRALQGIPKSSTILVDASAIGTDSLFSSAGKVAEEEPPMAANRVVNS